MTIRAKFQCNEISSTVIGDSVQLTAVTHGSEENEKFFKFTPSGELKLGCIQVVNADGFFKPGKEYYLDISEAQ